MRENIIYVLIIIVLAIICLWKTIKVSDLSKKEKILREANWNCSLEQNRLLELQSKLEYEKETNNTIYEQQKQDLREKKTLSTKLYLQKFLRSP